MNTLLTTPFPRFSLKFYLKVAFTVGFIVSFILIAFEPFGTASFKHDYKTWILLGYGAVIATVVGSYYIISTYVGARNGGEWNIIRESVDLFLSVILSVTACYFYALWAIDLPFSNFTFFYFIKTAFTIAILPVLFYAIWMYRSYKDVIRSTVEFSENDQNTTLELKGTNKHETLKAETKDILFIEASDNYVIISILKEEVFKRFMIRSTLKNIKDQLDDTIFKTCHRSYIVNTNKIIGIDGNVTSSKLSLNGIEKQIPVSRAFVAEFRKMLN